MATTSNDLNESIERNFLQFLLGFKKSFIEESAAASRDAFYVNKVREMKANGIRNLLVDFKHISELNGDDLDFDPLDFEMVIQEHYLRYVFSLISPLLTM